MSPLQIEIMLHYYYSGVDWPRCDSPASQTALREFVDHGMLAYMGKGLGPTEYAITKGGRMYVDALCETPLPVRKWVMPEQEEKT